MRATRVYFCLAILLLFPAGALTAPGLQFTATLDSIRITAEPGQIVNREFKLNLSPDQPDTQFQIGAADFWRSEDGKQSKYAEPGTLDRSCGEWLTLSPTEKLVTVDAPLSVRIRVAVPDTVEPGGYWCVLTVRQVPDPRAQSESGVRIRFLASVTVGLFVNIEPVQRRMRVTSINFDATEAQIGVTNEGNAPIGVEGRLEFLTADGADPVCQILIARHTVFTEPLRSARLAAKLPDSLALPSGEYLVRAVLDYGGDHFLGVQRRIRIER
jgi:hypothetical protein